MFIKNDGGRAAAGFKGEAGDCACRAIAIAAQIPYAEAYELINRFGAMERLSKNRRSKSSARTGVYQPTMRRIMDSLGFVWVPTMGIGTGCKTHLVADELPAGRVICSVSKHYVAVVDGVIHDTYDPSREGTRCVYGYWAAPNE